MIILATVLCIYLLFFRPVINARYPIFYSYLLLSVGFELLLSRGPFEERLGPSVHILAYQLIYLFQLYLLAYLWREVLQRDYPSLRLMVYLLMGLASATALFWKALTLPSLGLTSVMENALVLDGLAAPSFFCALLLIITFKEFRIPVSRHLRGIIYGLTILTGFDFIAIFVSHDHGFVVGYNRMAPWLVSLIIYCRYFTYPREFEAGPAHPSMLTTNPHLLELDQSIFYGFILKTRLYNPITEAFYYHFCSAGLADSKRQTPTIQSHFQRLYTKHRFHWAKGYYRLVDRLLLGPAMKDAADDWHADAPFLNLQPETTAPPSSISPELNFSGGALASQSPEGRSAQV